MPFDVDEANPPDDGIVSQFPANERASRQNIVDWMNHEHDEVSGRHKIPAGSIAARDGFTDWNKGSLWINTDANPNELQIQVNATSPFAWVTVGPAGAAFESGTVAFFGQATAPTGWTQDTNLNDRVLRVVSGAGAGTGGSWSVSGFQADSHVLTIAEIPAHTHDFTGIQVSNQMAGGAAAGRAADAPRTTQATGGGGGHTHTVSNDGNWRPAHVDIIAATKD